MGPWEELAYWAVIVALILVAVLTVIGLCLYYLEYGFGSRRRDKDQHNNPD